MNADKQIPAAYKGGVGLRQTVFWFATVGLICLSVVRSAVATRTDGFTIDDAYHITAGVFYAKTGNFNLNPEHPPLVKLWVGANVAKNFKLPPTRQLADKFDERNFTESAVFVENNPDQVRARARWSMYALNALLLLFFAFSVSRSLGSAVALGAIGFLAIDPTVSAHLPVVLTDLPVAVLGVAAVLFSERAFRTGSWIDTCFAVVALGLTLGAKHSGLVIFVAVLICGGAVVVTPAIAGRCATRWRAFRCILVISLGALLVLWGLYGFRYTETHSPTESFNRPLALKIQDVHSSAMRAALDVISSAHLLPRSYTWGLADTIRAGLEGRRLRGYFFGRTFLDRGPFYYFPVVIVSKLPLGLLALAIAGIALLATGRTMQSWRFPALALFLAGSLFLIALARGVSYGGIRHALPVVLVLAVFAGIVMAAAAHSQSRLPKLFIALAVGAAALSSIPQTRPWEYYNELVGGPEGAYLRIADEGLDVGQRSLDFVRYYHQHLEPAGEIPYLFYPISAYELKSAQVPVHDARGQETDQADQSADASGIFFLRSRQVVINPRFEVFRAVKPTDRIGNLLIYRGTFHLPWLQEDRLLSAARRVLGTAKPDLERGEAYLQEVLTVNPKSFVALLQLGNINLRRGLREESVRFYQLAREQVQDDEATREALDRQIERLSAGDALDRIRSVRSSHVE